MLKEVILLLGHKKEPIKWMVIDDHFAVFGRIGHIVLF